MSDGSLAADSLQFIKPDQLHDYWIFVRDGLDKILEKGGDRWLPEDVYSEIKAGRAFLHISRFGGEISGFVILTEKQDWDGKALHVWCAYSTAHGSPLQHVPELVQYAKNMGAKRLTFSSTRDGWLKSAPKHGFQVGQTFYELPVHKGH